VRALRRSGVALVAFALLLAGCSGSPGGNPPDSADIGGGKVIQEFASAWPDPEVANFRGIVDQPEVAAHDISAHVAELSITTTSVRLLDDLTCSSDSCREHAQVTHQLAGVGRWSYRTLITSTLNQGQWLVQWTPGTFNPDLTELTTLVSRRVLPPRAPILDRSGAALTPERAIVRIGVQPSLVRPATYTDLASVLQIDIANLQAEVRAAQPNWFVPVIDLRRSAYRPLKEPLAQVPGIVIDTAKRALAPTAEWGRAVLGTVGPATADALKLAGPATLPTDEVGLSGLQLAYQRSLAGSPGLTIDLVDKTSGDVLNQVLSRHPIPGQPLSTTLDIQAQTAAEQAVAGATDTTAVVVVKASTGEILAAANAPGPTSYNTAFVGRYAPGSTFKVVSASSLIEHKVVTPQSPVTCPDTRVVDGKQFKNYELGITGPNPTFADAFAASCNTTMVGFAGDLTGGELARSGSQVGLGADWHLGLDAYSGSVPADSDLVTRAADMIGQGKVEASPLAMAMVAAAVDSGVARTPTLLPDLLPGVRLDQLNPAVDADVQSMMRLVVTQGTGTSVNLPGIPVYAKTGTAEFQDGNHTSTNAWMIGYRGDVAFAVLVAHGSSGAHDAGPIVDTLLNLLPESLYG
jgi:cell division protein FtsI/penicillin-binding protein 2